jgi:dipeptide transport system permease protein
MLNLIFSRLVLAVPTFLGVTLLSFGLIRLVPGDPIEVRSGQYGIAPERLAELRHQYGLDQPLWKQFFDYLWQLAHGDLGVSLVTHQPVLAEMRELFPATIELSFCAIVLAVAVGVPLGIVAATRRGTVLDYGLMATSVVGASMPIFFWGLTVILIFSITLGWTPVAGRISDDVWVEPFTGFMLIDAWFSDDAGSVLSVLHHLILPTIVLATIPLAIIARMTRSTMLEVLGEDYVRTARAKGARPSRVIGIHALRNALIPVVTVIGLQTGMLLGGAILTETIFSWPGVGHWLVEAIQRRDYPVLQGGVLVIAMLAIVVNLLVDIAYGLLDPRMRA